MSNKKHLITIEDLSDKDIAGVFERSEYFLKESVIGRKRLSTLKDKILINLFFENSTRTRTSFEIAAKNLGATVVNIQVENSSVKKGETLEDTLLTIDAMHPDFIAIRHSSSGMVGKATEYVRCHIINAGDGCHEHPTQGLLDTFVIRQRKKDFKGLKVTICGDVLHSRVARSDIKILKRLGAEITVVAPPTLMPAFAPSLGVKTSYKLDEVLAETDALILLRLQNERMNGNFVPSAREYFRLYGLSNTRLANAKKDMMILHPGPVNRGVELEGSLAADRKKTSILDQVEAGVAVRMAVLEMLSAS